MKYHIIGFGENPNGFFNEPKIAFAIQKAKEYFESDKQNPELIGSVLIQIDHEKWAIIDQFQTENVSVSLGESFLGSVKKLG